MRGPFALIEGLEAIGVGADEILLSRNTRAGDHLQPITEPRL
jgi:hypothetical protein